MTETPRSSGRVHRPVGAGQESNCASASCEAETKSDRARFLESVIECLPDGVMVADRSGSLLACNSAAHRILGLGPGDAPPTDWVRNLVCHLPVGSNPSPSDPLPARPLRRGEVGAAEISIRNEQLPDGRWINSSVHPWRDEVGSTRGALVILREVSDESESRELRSRLFKAVEGTTDSVVMTETDGTIVYVNPAFEDTTGYSRGEALGSTPRLLRSGQHDEPFYERLWSTVLAGGVFRGTLVNRKKNGELYRSEQTISPIPGPHGRCEYIVSVGRDITELLEGERNLAQLEAGQAIQERLYPKRVPKLQGFDISGGAQPAEFLCGDYYDFLTISGDRQGMTIADVCGHGVGPSILMAQTRAYLRMLARYQHDVGEVLRELNEILTVQGSQREYVTQILVCVDPRARTLVYANAGHPAGFLFDRDGEVRLELGSCDIPLGLFPNRSYPSSGAIPLEHGELVVLYTDGISESLDPGGVEFGTKRLLEVVGKHHRESADEIRRAIHKAACRHRAGGRQLDDMTSIVCKVDG